MKCKQIFDLWNKDKVDLLTYNVVNGETVFIFVRKNYYLK